MVERWSHNPRVVSSILTPANFAWMNSEAWASNPRGINVPVVRIHLLRVRVTSFYGCAGMVSPRHNQQKTKAVPGEQGCSMRGSNPRPLAHKTNTLPTELMEHACRSWLPASSTSVESRVRGLVVMIVACQVMDPGSIPGERKLFLFTSPGSRVGTGSSSSSCV